MAAKISYTWYGNVLAKKVDAAAEAAVNKVNEEAAAAASGMTPRDTGRLADSMDSVPAVKEGGRWVGSFGSLPDAKGPVKYAIFVEGGANGRAGVFMIRRAADQWMPQYGPILRGLLG